MNLFLLKGDKMKRLMIDMDNCITDALFIERINEFLGTNYKLNEQSEFRLQNLLGNKVNDFWKYMENRWQMVFHQGTKTDSST